MTTLSSSIEFLDPTVTILESNGGRDAFNWEATIPVALVALLGPPAEGKGQDKP